MKRQPTPNRIAAVSAALACLVLSTDAAQAGFHPWDITEVYSNADGTLQFIEWFTAVDTEEQLGDRVVTTESNTFTFPNDLPSPATAGRNFLMATAGFAALPGAPVPDFIMPDGFIDVTSDTLRLRTSQGGMIWETFSFGIGELPANGVDSLICSVHSGSACMSTDVEVNSPTNFAGDSGSVMPPPACSADLDGDGGVGASDLAQLLGSWGPCPECSADLDGSGDVGAFDLALLLGAWGPCP